MQHLLLHVGVSPPPPGDTGPIKIQLHVSLCLFKILFTYWTGRERCSGRENFLFAVHSPHAWDSQGWAEAAAGVGAVSPGLPRGVACEPSAAALQAQT